jgi:hypothetical protein
MSIINKDGKQNQKTELIPEESGNPRLDTSVKVTFPSELHIELVQANEIRNYEIFQWLTALTTTIGAAFVTSYFLTENTAAKGGLGWSAIAFTVLSGIFIYFAHKHRSRAFSKTIKKSISLAEFKLDQNRKFKNQE